MDILGLNNEQQRAVTTIEGPLLILAGAGSGKTRVLTHRIAHLIEDCGVFPYQIAALTFTNKAASEMKSRVINLVGQSGHEVWMGTFHSICVRILRAHAELIGYQSNFVIYDTGDQKEVIKQILKRFKINDKDLPINLIKNVISDAKNKRIGVAKFKDSNASDFRLKRIGDIYSEYQCELKKNNAMDFDDLIINVLNLFDASDEVLQRYQEKFKFIHVDEYQDTNHVQYLFVKKLAQKHGNICVVGDGDQSIYSWRGADIRNIRDFERDFLGASIVKLEQNYRSTKVILKAANNVITHNNERHDKALWTDNADGDLIGYYRANSAEDEARFVAEQIEQLNCGNLGHFAVLYRTNAQSRVFENAFNRAGIAYKIIGGHRFYERQEIKDLMAYLKFIANPLDEVSLRRIINTPKRNIGAKTVEKLQAIASAQALSFYDAMHYAVAHQTLSPKTLNGIKQFLMLVTPLIEDIDKISGSQILLELIEKTSYKAQLVAEGSPQSMSRVENIEELVNQVIDFEQKYDTRDLNTFLQEISLLSDQDTIVSDNGEVLLMTIHAAKGLEFDTVFLVGFEDNLFPSSMAMESSDGLEEERRLCYVAVTRAEQKLFITHAQMRMRFGKVSANPISRFMDEIPRSLIKSYSGEIASKDDMGTKHTLRASAYSKPVARPALNSGEYKAGQRVRHKIFGDGMIVSVKNETTLTIAFDKKGIKNLDANFAPLEIIKG